MSDTPPDRLATNQASPFYDAAALAQAAPYIDALGGAEDLAAHVNAVRARSADVSDS